MTNIHVGAWIRDLAQVAQTKDVNVMCVNDVMEISRIVTFAKLLNPKYVIADHYNSIEVPGLDVFCAPFFVADEIIKNKPYSVAEPTTEYTFNFMINKKQASRFLCIKFVEMFELTGYDYTWSGAGQYFDLTKFNQELDSLGNQCPLTDHQRWWLGEPILLEPKFKFPGEKQPHNEVSIEQYGGNRWAWEHGGLKEMFASSAVSLITESGAFDRASSYTEKTVYSVLGLSMPIWVGGFQQAKYWNEIGFDIFDDVIDHSYQNYPTLIERCYYAFKNNLELLTNFEKVKELRAQLLPRLENNRNLLLNDSIVKYIQQKTSNWPLEIQEYLPIGLEKHYPHLSKTMLAYK